MKPQNEAIAGLKCKSEYHKASIVKFKCQRAELFRMDFKLFSLKQ